ncbi:hypothetical protein L596_012748 [Steinernema carpocapsae]|uniref:Uncharacterized protein n=1 Tax=Steinernema carpocapsae TaxID=34508 RepID=A0A4U5NYN4_STECR|nr:hypothetical protein L596_012748 [Steinernema carpocapsae]
MTLFLLAILAVLIVGIDPEPEGLNVTHVRTKRQEPKKDVAAHSVVLRGDHRFGTWSKTLGFGLYGKRRC